MTPALLALIMQLADAERIPPKLVMAVIQIESAGNPASLGEQGEIGLMQIMPVMAKGIERKALFNPETNVRVGIKLLAEAKKSCIHQIDYTYVICFNKGEQRAQKVKHPFKDKYYIKVMKALSFFNNCIDAKYSEQRNINLWFGGPDNSIIEICRKNQMRYESPTSTFAPQ